MKNIFIDGRSGKVQVIVGSLLCYKDDFETWGKVIKIENDIITIENGNSGKIVARTPFQCWDE